MRTKTKTQKGEKRSVSKWRCAMGCALKKVCGYLGMSEEEALSDYDPLLFEGSEERIRARRVFPGKRVMLLEDNPACGEILSNFLGRWGMKVSWVQQCRDAIALAEAGEQFDCLILDYSLPDGTGDEVVSGFRLRGSARIFVALTGSHFMPDSTLYQAVLQKPFSPSEMRRALLSSFESEERLAQS